MDLDHNCLETGWGQDSTVQTTEEDRHPVARQIIAERGATTIVLMITTAILDIVTALIAQSTTNVDAKIAPSETLYPRHPRTYSNALI